MTDTGPLSVDRKGFVRYRGVCLPVRYEGGALEFAIKHPADRARLKCARVKVPVQDFAKLKRPAPQSKTHRPARREFRAMDRAASISRRNKEK